MHLWWKIRKKHEIAFSKEGYLKNTREYDLVLYQEELV